jgi:hypothetical protein
VSSRQAVAAGTYLALFLLGLAQAVLGAFFYSSGPVPLAALGFDVAICCSCLLGGWGMSRPAGALAPAAGWFVTAFLLASGTPGGSILITATTAGTSFLFGGAAGAAVGLVAAFVLWSRGGSRGARAGSGGGDLAADSLHGRALLSRAGKRQRRGS